MGTRADFYIGRGEQAEWLGSVAWDGNEWDDPAGLLMQSKTAEEFRGLVAGVKEQRDDFTDPSEGWPWPWDDSLTTDYAYVFHEGTVTAYTFGCEMFVNADGEIDARDEKVAWFPDMSKRSSMAPAGSIKSGILLVQTRDSA